MRINERFLLLSAAGLLAAGMQSSRLSAQAVASVNLAGVVIDQQGVPVARVELSLQRGNRTSSSTRSRDDGRFEFRDVAPGRVAIVAQRIGYRVRTMQVAVGTVDSQQSVEIDLISVPVDIEAVVIEETPGRLQEFTEHRKQSKFGHFLDQNQIRKQSPQYLSELFRAIPGARLAPSPGGGNKLLLRGCKPKIWVDGVLAQYAEIDDVIGPTEIAGIEIYPSWAGVPAQYMDRENRACGTVLIWSRQA